MTELFDTNQVKDDAAHWDALAERVAREAARRPGQAGLGALATSRAGLIAASLLLAASVAFMTITSRQGSSRPAAELGQALAPRDDVGRAIALTQRPPAVAALLFAAPRGGGRPQ